MKTLLRILLPLCLLAPLCSGPAEMQAQYIPTHLSHEGIYLLLDELATAQVIDLSTLVRPYGRSDIAELLVTAGTSEVPLTPRQQKEVEFYLRDYGKALPPDRASAASWLWQKKHGDKRFDVFYYSDSLFRITVNPILGADVWANGNGTFSHWWNGVEVWSSVGRFGFWASLRDNHESTELTARDFQNDRIGAANLKTFQGGKRDYEEFRGGVTYAWEWGHAGLIMDQFSWGEHNAGSNILSGRTPSYARLELSLEPVHWFRFEYIHGFLHSEVVDSSQSFWVSNAYGDEYRQVYHSKYIAANLFEFTPVRGLKLAIGNSTVYDSRYPRAGFLVPVAFFKAVDHSQNARIDNMNAQIFLSASSRNLKHFHFHGTVFIDELAVGRFTDPAEHNFLSFKGGMGTTILPDFRLVAEYTWTNALTFMHYVPTTTFESNRYNLGHYLEDNAKDLYLAAEYRPWRTLLVKAYYNRSVKGPDHTELGTMPRDQVDPFEPVVWESSRAGLLATAQLANDLYLRAGVEWRQVEGGQDYLDRWTPEEYHGTTTTLRLGLNYGF